MNALSRFIRKCLGMPVTVPVVVDKKVIENYVIAGMEFGEAVNLICLGECIGFEDLLNKWEEFEHAYACLGFRTCSIDDFVSAVRLEIDVKNKLEIPRDLDEKPIYHAAHYRNTFLGKIQPSIDMNLMFQDCRPQYSTDYASSIKQLRGNDG